MFHHLCKLSLITFVGKYMGGKRSCILLIIFLVPISLNVLWGQSERRMQAAYHHFINTKDENRLRFQIIHELNFPDFLQGGRFLKQQNNSRINDILIEVLKSYNRYDLVEPIFFSNPLGPFEAKYKQLYYETLLNNLKSATLINVLLFQIEELNQKLKNSKTRNIDPDEVYRQVHLELHFLQEIVRKRERQLVQWEDSIRRFPFTTPQKKKEAILLNHLYFAFTKKPYLKKIYQSLITEPSPLPKKEPEAGKNNYDEVDLNSRERFFDLGDRTDRLNSSNIPAKEKNLNSAENFFNLDEIDHATEQDEHEQPIIGSTDDSIGVVYDVIEGKTKTKFLDTLYRQGYYRNYLHLLKIQSQRLSPGSLTYKRFIDAHQDRVSQARIYSKTFSAIPGSSSQKMDLRILFYQNEYQRIIENFKSFQQNDFYLLSLAAKGQWEILFTLVQTNPLLIKSFQRISLLVRKPDQLLKQLQQSPSQSLKSWQLDFLNLVEEGLSPQMIAPVITSFLFKKKNFLAQLKIQPQLLHEYGVTLQAQILHEQGRYKEIGKLFRKYYNQIQSPALKEQLMYLHGIASLNEDPAEGEKILFQVLSLNPQSSYRFDIEEALNSLL